MHPFQYPAELKRVHGTGRLRSAGTDTLADDCKSLETTCDQGLRAIAVFDFSENVTFGPSYFDLKKSAGNARDFTR